MSHARCSGREHVHKLLKCPARKLEVALFWFCQTKKGDVKLKATRKHKNRGFLYTRKKQQSGVFLFLSSPRKEFSKCSIL